MIYFAHKRLPGTTAPVLEKAIRAFSSKRHTSLDFKSSLSYLNKDKYFLGLDGEDDLQITRIRTPFERFFPKLILSVPKDQIFQGYRIRYSLLSTIIFVLVAQSLVRNLYEWISHEGSFDDVFPMLLVLVFFIVFTIVEMALTKRLVLKSIQQLK